MLLFVSSICAQACCCDVVILSIFNQMASHSVVDTTTPDVLLLHAGLHKDALNQIQTDRVVRPCNVVESEGSSWVVLNTETPAAADMAMRWVFDDELGKEKDESQLNMITFEFTALGVCNFMFTNKLTTRDDWKQFQFHGDLPLRCTNMQGELLLVQALDAVSSVS